ncbi:MAG: hypothetical protein PCFJNLEI_00804 [Verrucomicrobiae bacterium]|nr:hypothetical protein [Verrucomicrobiae bacterium]
MTTYLSECRPGVQRWLDAVRAPNTGWGRWKYNAHMLRPYGLISSGIAILIHKQIGALADIPPAQRQEAIEFFQSTQDPQDGYFKDPLVRETDRVPDAIHSWEDIWGQMGVAARALAALGAAPLYPLPATSFADLRSPGIRAEVLRWNWANPWHVGERFYRAVAAFRGPAGDPLVENFFQIYETEIHDPATGMPLRRGCQDSSVAMAGLFKMMWAYEHVNRPVPAARAAVDFTLGLQHADGEFGFRNNMCINFDALWVLYRLDRQLGGAYRHADIVAAGNRLAELLMQTYRKADGGFAFTGTTCWTVHHSIRISEAYPEGDVVGTNMALDCLIYADEWNHSGNDS